MMTCLIAADATVAAEEPLGWFGRGWLFPSQSAAPACRRDQGAGDR
jgi:hypothetical protein